MNCLFESSKYVKRLNIQEDLKMLAKYNRFYVPAYMDDFFNDAVSNRYYGKGYASRPAVNIVEENDEYRIDIAAAGLARDDFKIKIEDDVITVSSEKEESSNEENRNYTRREFNYGNFSRSFRLNEMIDQEKIRAEHRDGVLSVYLPRKEEAVKPGPRSIEIG